MCKSSKSLDWRGFDCCSFSCLSVAVANEDELYWISHQNYFDRDQMWACGCICQISWNTLHRGYSHFLLTVGGQMIPGLVLDPVGIRLTHCNFELILFVGGWCIGAELQSSISCIWLWESQRLAVVPCECQFFFLVWLK